jgi:LuxR family maltose regulon positive regulatory protein
MDRPSNIQITITYLAQLLVALHHTGQRDRARVVVVRLIALTEPEGFLRVFLDEGDPMRQALEDLLATGDEENPAVPPSGDTPHTAAVPLPRSAIMRVLAAFDQEADHHADHSDTPVSHPAPQAAIRQQREIESLTQAEARVLRLLVAGQTYAEMAEALVVSPNTIKTQVSSIYRKLGVSRRAEAIAAVAHVLPV